MTPTYIEYNNRGDAAAILHIKKTSSDKLFTELHSLISQHDRCRKSAWNATTRYIINELQERLQKANKRPQKVFVYDLGELVKYQTAQLGNLTTEDLVRKLETATAFAAAIQKELDQRALNRLMDQARKNG